MSIEAMRAVWKHSESRGTDRMVMTLIANSANPEGWGSYQFQETIAEGANTSLRTVERSVEKAIAAGELEVHRPDRTKQCHYSVMLPGLAIHDDPDERERRDEHYEQLALGRAEKTRQTRQKRRSEDPSPVSGPGAEGPDSLDGSDPTDVTGPDPTPASGAHPSPVSGLKEETSLNTFETPEKELAQAAEALWRLYPHNRRDLDEARTVDVLAGLGITDVAGVERVAAALTEDLQSKDFQEGFNRKFSKWLKDRQWDRPVAALIELNVTSDVEQLDEHDQAEIFDDIHTAIGSVFDAFLTYGTWLGQRGAQLVVGIDRDVDYFQRRYGRVLDTVARNRGFAGVDVINAADPYLKETAA